MSDCLLHVNAVVPLLEAVEEHRPNEVLTTPKAARSP
jgi:hypothetical protein